MIELFRQLTPVDIGVRWDGLVIWNHVAKLGIPITDRSFQSHRLLEGLDGLAKSFRSHTQHLSDLFQPGRSPQLLAQSPHHSKNTVRGFGLMNRNADRSRLVRKRSSDPLTDPPGCVCAELESLSILIPFRRFHQPDVAFLHEIQQAQPSTGVMFGDVDDQAKITPNKLILALF